MISTELMNEHKIKRLSYSIKNVPYFDVGFVRAYLGECENKKWLVVITDENRNEVEVMVLNTRATGMKRIRERGFWTRMSVVKNLF